MPLAALVAILAIGVGLYLGRRRGLLAALRGIVDRSVAMWLLRRLTGRPDPLDVADGDEQWGRSPAGVAGGIGAGRPPTPLHPSRLIVTGGLPARYRRTAPRRPGRRRLALDTAAIVFVAGGLAYSTGLLPALPGGAVLSTTNQRSAPPSPAPTGAPPGQATGAPSGTVPSPSTPAATRAPGTAAPLVTALPRTPTPSRRPAGTTSPAPAATPAPTQAPSAAPTATAGASATPTVEPSPTPTPTPTPTSEPAPAPTPTPTPTPDPTPTPTPTPTPKGGPPGSPGPPGG